MNLPLLDFIVLVLLILTPKAKANHENPDREGNYHVGSEGISIGAIVDDNSRIGKEQRVAMEMAVEDFNGSRNQSLVLYIRNSSRVPVHAALAAMDLINEQEVQAILGPQTWQETSSVAEIARQKQIPLLSFADATPNWTTERYPFLIQASPSQEAQLKAIAAIVQSWEWHQVTVIYEDIDSSATGVIHLLSEALREAGAEIINLLALPPFPSPTLTKELEHLKSGWCRVFVVHLSLELAVHLFGRAKKMGMMEKNYIWITTDAFTSLLHSINASTISSMQGILGVKSYYPETKPHFQDFSKRFRKRFGSEYPEENIHDPGAPAAQAYDAVWSIAFATRKSKKVNNQTLLQSILLSDFDGLTGKVQFINQKVVPAHIYQIINLIGMNYTQLGYWSYKLGFSKSIDGNAQYNFSMKDLGQVLWPGAPLHTPRGWSLPTSAKPLRIGIPMNSQFKEYVNVVHDKLTNVTSFKGFSIELFRLIVDQLPLHLPYTFIPFSGSYDDLVKQIYLKNFDAVAGDVAIVAARYQYAEFTPPYTESGLVMIVPVRESTNKTLLFIKPFTKAMWILVLIVTIYNGFILWLIERKHQPELEGSTMHQQSGTFLLLSFSCLFSSLGEKLHSNLARMTMVVWLFVALVISQTYTASLTSMLTVQGLQPNVDNIESLQSRNANIGYLNVSYYPRYLNEVLRFNTRNLKGYSSIEQCAKDLRSGNIAAMFLDAPLAKVFLERYWKSFTRAGPTYKVGGIGFVINSSTKFFSFRLPNFPAKGLQAFAKGSPLLPMITNALLNVSESGELRELEKRMIGSQKCVELDLPDEISSLGPSKFLILFLLTGGTSTIALIAYLENSSWKISEYLLLHKKIRMVILVLSKHWSHRQNLFSRRVCDAESLGSSPNSSEAGFV